MILESKKYRLPKSEILKGRNNFDLVFQKGSAIAGQYIVILYIKSESRKIGFAVSKKIKKAVHRNRLKRILREIYRLNRDFFPDRYYFILLAKGTNDNIQTIKNDVLSTVKKIRNGD